MPEPTPRWDGPEVVTRRSSRSGAAGSRRATRAAGAPVVRAWAGLYDMTPDAHPIIGQVATASTWPAASRATASCRRRPWAAVAAELLGDEPQVDLAPYRLERFAGGAVFPESLVL